MLQSNFVGLGEGGQFEPATIDEAREYAYLDIVTRLLTSHSRGIERSNINDQNSVVNPLADEMARVSDLVFMPCFSIR